MREINEKEYRDLFIENSAFPNRAEEIHKKAYDVALENLRFESSSYWKRANYYWLFQASIYAGYFYSVMGKNKDTLYENSIIIVGITCLGFLTAFAWFLSNIGSEKWHNIWVHHLYELEDSITGPLYKTTNYKTTFSLTRINKLVSLFSIIAWILIGFRTIFIFYSNNCCAYMGYVFSLCVISFAFWFYCKREIFQTGIKIKWYKIAFRDK
ncbi:hypothetical protein R83H12_02969 [Fibrobacteria bacterium R8-3-H12]